MDSRQFNYKMVVMYDGTPFSGWQVQPNGISIQQKLQEAIHIITKEEASIIGSGRTDAGVHAMGQTASFKVGKELDLYRFQHSLNALVPREICVKEITPAPLDFHAQYSAKSKTYRYHICTSRYQSPFTRLYSWHVTERLDLPLLKDSAAQLLGTHNFTSFANEAHAGSASKDPIRTLTKLNIIDEAAGLTLEFEANGFLYKMVRNITGTLIDIAAGRLPSGCIPAILDAKDRRKAGAAAPPHGLFLYKVDY